jgi:hypothetical protein
MHEEPVFACTGCFDEPNGWRSFWCPGAGRLRLASRPEWGLRTDAQLRHLESLTTLTLTWRGANASARTRSYVRGRNEKHGRPRERQHGEEA